MNYLSLIKSELTRLTNEESFKYETALQSAQDGIVKVRGKELVMLGSNNYLGMSNHPTVKKAAIDGINKYGYGVASVRFICGTQEIHLGLEKTISDFVGAEDTILFSSSFAANQGFIATLLNESFGEENYRDAIYTDLLNHASIIDAIRLCKSQTTEKNIYEHANLNQLEQFLEKDKNKNYRFRLIATDGVFSMEGDLVDLKKLVELAKKYNAILFVDDCHGIGVCGKSGRGTPEHFGVLGKIDVLSGTLGKAIGGAAGGYVSGKKELISFLRQKSRPYTFSNSLPPAVVCASIAAFNLLKKDKSLVKKLHENTFYFRNKISKLGFKIIDGIHPVVPVMLGETALTQKFSKELLKSGVFAKGLWFPVVPKGEARIRVQISAAHNKASLDRALEIFSKVGKKLNVI
ncbi:MAG: glycine C-acetyltransferase [Bacteroidota bacterium]